MEQLTNLFLMDALAVIMSAFVLLMSKIVSNFSLRYMEGDLRKREFFDNLGLLSLTVVGLVNSNHVVLFCAAWILMGHFLSRLIGHVRNWGQAQASARICRQYFLWGDLCLVIALGVLAVQTGEWTISAMMERVPQVEGLWVIVATFFLLLSCMVQSAIFPFHRWLLCSLNAPTPVSSFMHAGLVNAGGFLLARFHELFILPEQYAMVLTAGSLSAIFGTISMLVQSDIKKSLACSTVAQMGFMLVQCGLGLYSVAVAHLMLHGLYKAYYFLNVGSNVGSMAPLNTNKSSNSTRKFHFGHFLASLVIGLSATYYFEWICGTTLYPLNSNSVLLFFIILATTKASYDLLLSLKLSYLLRVKMAMMLIFGAMTVYGLTTLLIGHFIDINRVQEFTLLHALIIVVFGVGWALIQFGKRTSSRPYIYVINATQVPTSTTLSVRSNYRAG